MIYLKYFLCMFLCRCDVIVRVRPLRVLPRQHVGVTNLANLGLRLLRGRVNRATSWSQRTLAQLAAMITLHVTVRKIRQTT